MQTSFRSPQLQLQALYDLTMRAKAGIYIYLAIWLVIVFAFDFLTLNNTFVIINSAIIVLISILRIIHLKLVKSANEENTALLYKFLIASVMTSALHWGFLTAWILMFDKVTSAPQLMLIVLPAFAMGGASTLSISNALRIFYPLALYVPPVIVFFYLTDPLSIVYAISILASYAYIVAASNYSADNYWSAITNHLVAEERAQELEKLSNTDQLTQLKNRMFFDNEYQKEWLRATRIKSPLSIIMIDIDHFKKINDTYGHVFGDEVLQLASSIISNELKRPTDCVARYGGEEFVALLPNTDMKGAKRVGERVRKAIEDMAINHQGETVRITCSVGGANVTPSVSSDKTLLIKDADSALYRAKQTGRNRYLDSSDIEKI